MDLTEIDRLDKEYFTREAEPKHIQITRSEGSYLFDHLGRRYIDFTMGWNVGNVGWNNPEIKNALKNFSGPDYVQPHFEYEPWTELSQLLADLTPGNLKKCFRATGGTEAVEIALQAALEFTGRKKFLAIDGAYHGNSLATLGLVSEQTHGFFNWNRITLPLNEDKLNEVENILKRREIAAFIMEPVIMNLGVYIPEEKFMKGVGDLCQKYGTLLIVDEVASGFGRTGRMFASEYFEISPDIMCLGKGITGGAAGMGAVVMKDEVAESLISENFPYSTYGWHPFSVEAALANIRYLQTHWNELDENIESLGEYFQERLEHMKFEQKPEVSVMGLAVNLKFEDPSYGKRITKKAEEKGLFLSGSISMFPALNLEFQIAQEGLNILESCL